MPPGYLAAAAYTVKAVSADHPAGYRVGVLEGRRLAWVFPTVLIRLDDAPAAFTVPWPTTRPTCTPITPAAGPPTCSATRRPRWTT